MNIVGLDTETCLIMAGVRAPALVCVTVSGPTDNLWRWDEKQKIFKIFTAAANNELKIIGHNISYDTCVLCAQYPDLIPIIFEAYTNNNILDTALAEMLLDIESGRKPIRPSLVKLHSKYIDDTMVKDEDTWRLHYSELRNVPLQDWPESAKVYAVKDATCLPIIFNAQNAIAKHEGTFDNLPARARIAFALGLMSAWGLKTDLARVKELEASVMREQARVRDGLMNSGLMRPNGSFDQGVLIDLCQRGGTTLPLTAGGKPSTKAEYIKDIDNPIIADYILYKEQDKLRRTYLQKYKSGLIQCQVNPILTNGRASLSKPSMQNLPARGAAATVREVFIPRDGNVLCSIDYDGVELRTFAQHCLDVFGHSKLADIYRADPSADVPSMEGAALAGISADEGIARAKANDPTFKPFRKGAKAALYGFHGGMGINTFIKAQKSQGTIFSVAEAKALKAQHMAWLPEVKPFFEHIKRDHIWHVRSGSNMRVTESVTTRSGRYRGDMGFCQVSNEKFSAPMADGSGEAMFQLVRHMYSIKNSVLYGSRLVCYIHDEGLLELDKDGAHEQAMCARQIMCDTMQKQTPDIPITAGPALMSRWYKDAEGVYNNGRLVLWK